MNTVDHITFRDGDTLKLRLKVAVCSGMTRRFVVGDPGIQLVDTVAGAPVTRLAAGEALARSGEVLADSATVEYLRNFAHVQEWRGGDPDGGGTPDRNNERFAVLVRVEPPFTPTAAPVEIATVSAEQLHPWMLSALVQHLRAGFGEFGIELRPVTALFVQFSGIDYEADADAQTKLDMLLRQTQAIVNAYKGSVLQLTIGDKGSYLYATFGAPLAHEDDTARALSAALNIQQAVEQPGDVNPVRIGISRGIMRAGAYGSATRRTYGVQGDDVNLAARLMTLAQPGTI